MGDHEPDTKQGPDTFHMADVWEAVADRVPDRVAVTCGDVSRTYAEVEERSNRLAHAFAAQGVGPGDHVGIYLTNRHEYLEAMFAAFKLRAVPINVNYRYVADELHYLFDDADLVGVVHGSLYTDTVARVLPDVPSIGFTISVSDGPGTPAGTYEDVLAAQSPDRDFGPRSNDDHYVIYTGGTTGMPKGVVWRQEDAFFACIGGGDPMRLSGPVGEPAELLDRIIDFDFVAYPLAPLMHAAAQWTGLSWLFCGGRLVLNPGSFDARAVWETVEREKVSTLIMVGDAMARPLVDAWEEFGPYDVSGLYAVGSGGAPLSPHLRDRFVEMLPSSTITDGFGSSETGAQGSQRIEPGSAAAQASGAGDGGEPRGVTKFTRLGEGTTVLAEDRTEVQPGSGVIGRVALSGRIPLGYHNAPEKTAETFVEVGGRRWVITGDAATVDEDGSITLLGRGSVSINTGGEKVYPEEVESAVKSHPDVYDCVVVGIPDERWGERVCAVVQPNEGAAPPYDSIVEHCRGMIAAYKLPRAMVLVDQIVRSPVGKADYPWAKQTALESNP
jgi:acyl-CoA synthetase (AMP-forming)/AMP-acid ligase II